MTLAVVLILAAWWTVSTLLNHPPRIRRAIIAVREAGRLTIVEGEYNA